MKKLVRLLITIVLILMLLGAIVVFTASGTYSASKFNNMYYLFGSHIWKVLVAIALLFLIPLLPYDYYRKYSKYILMIAACLLIVTLFMPRYKGASRWIELSFIGFQPSEIVKIAVIIHIAKLIEKKGDLISDFKKGFMYCLFWVLFVCTLLFFQPKVSDALIIAITSFSILYVGGARLKHIIFTALSFGTPAVLLMFLIKHTRERILTFYESFINGGDANIQVMQAKIALGSGYWLGVGLGHSRQSDLFLPESYGDFIFSIIGEELGFIGAALVLILYLVLFIAALIIAKKAQDKFGQLLAFGLAVNIMMSVIVNTAVVIGLIPTTGITLPFISFGGTSIMIFAVSVGIIINVANQSLKTSELKLAQV
ncbi:FtsW/RodA/SpoVE family cell cycle protein [Melioribacteraceae bacterium 4301-Me]|uniref:FtsW/RodA/SpoVE family cell cycle protein n=1 Tax=Pyranulibacter aquaticus TaxID=3163344 RepID=UPI0035995FE8